MLLDKLRTHKYPGGIKPAWGEKDAQKLLCDYGTIRDNGERVEKLKSWPVEIRKGIFNFDISGPVTDVCKSIVPHIVRHLDGLYMKMQRAYASDSFGQGDESQISTVYMFGQNSNIEGLPEMLKERMTDLGSNMDFARTSDLRYAVAKGALAKLEVEVSKKDSKWA